MSDAAAALIAASMRLVGSLLRMETGLGPEEGPEEVMESTIWSAIVGLTMRGLGNGACRDGSRKCCCWRHGKALC